MKLHHLQDSRSIRIVWLLEELKEANKLPNGYELASYHRVNGKGAEEALKKSSANGKSPNLEDDGITILESSSISQYLAERYDKDGLLPAIGDYARRTAVITWANWAESTLMTHLIPQIYARWFLDDEKTERHFADKLGANVIKDLDYLEGQLAKQQKAGHNFVVGDRLTIADTMLGFSVDFCFAKDISYLTDRKKSEAGISKGRWPAIDKWTEAMHSRPAWKRAAAAGGDDMYQIANA